MRQEINGWRLCHQNNEHPLGERSFYQKKLKGEESFGIYGNLYIYNLSGYDSPYQYELEIQIPEDYSGIGRTINITVFTYKELNLEQVEQDALTIINKLSK